MAHIEMFDIKNDNGDVGREEGEGGIIHFGKPCWYPG